MAPSLRGGWRFRPARRRLGVAVQALFHQAHDQVFRREASAGGLRLNPAKQLIREGNRGAYVSSVMRMMPHVKGWLHAHDVQH